MSDLIDRQAAIEAVHKTIYGLFDIVDDDSEEPFTKEEERFLVINKAITTRIKSLPSAQPEQKTVIYSGDGYTDGHMVYDLAECPECGYEYEEGDMSWGEPYCPHCGQSLNWDTEGDWKWMT